MKRIFSASVKLAALSMVSLASVSTAHAKISDMEGIEAAFSGNMSGIEKMSEQELGEARGGFGGILFSLTGYGDISQLSGGLPEGVSIGSMSPDLVSLNVGLGSLPNTGGFIQFASIIGNNNVINHTLNLNVYILQGGVADTSGIPSGAFLGLR